MSKMGTAAPAVNLSERGKAMRAAEADILAADGPFTVDGTYYAPSFGGSPMNAERARRRAAERIVSERERNAQYLQRFATLAVDQARVDRSAGLTVEAIGPEQYRVTGGAEPHHVDLSANGAMLCSCGDHQWRGTLCKHALASLRVQLGEVA